MMKQDIISYISTVDDTRTKSMFFVHFGRHNNWIGKLIIYQLSYKILYIIMKICPFITPIIKKSFFSMLSQQQHINMQITYSV